MQRRVATMVEMQVSEHHVGDVGRAYASLAQGLVQVVEVEKLVIAERLEVFVSGSVVHQDDPPVGFDQECAHGQDASVLGVAGIAAAPG